MCCLCCLYNRPWLFKRWIALSTEQITIRRIGNIEVNCVIHWIEIYSVDIAIHLSNDRGQAFFDVNTPKMHQIASLSIYIILSIFPGEHAHGPPSKLEPLGRSMLSIY